MLSRFSHVPLFANLWTVACRSLYMGFSRQEYWNGLPCPLPGDLPDPGIKPVSCISCTAGRFFYCWTIGEKVSKFPVLCLIFEQQAFLLGLNCFINIPCFYYTLIYCPSQIMHFYKLKVCHKPVSANLTAPLSQQHFLTFCFCVTFQQFSQHFKLFHYYICYGDLWSVIYYNWYCCNCFSIF